MALQISREGLNHDEIIDYLNNIFFFYTMDKKIKSHLTKHGNVKTTRRKYKKKM